MAKCNWCNRDMLTSKGCKKDNIIINGKEYKQIKYGDESSHWDSERCHDCNCERGQYHHPGCDVERCPVCEGQLISCGCLE